MGLCPYRYSCFRMKVVGILEVLGLWAMLSMLFFVLF